MCTLWSHTLIAIIVPCAFFRYFQQLNTELYTVLMEAHASDDHLITVEMIQALGLDPDKDRIFLTELATLHRLNVTVQRQADVFSCCI